MKKVKSSIPVYDIGALNGAGQLKDHFIAEPFGAYLKSHPNLHSPHGHSFYHMVLFTKGGGHHTIDFNRYAVQPGMAYFMVPGQVHSWEFEGETDGFVVNFSESFFRDFLEDDHYLEQFNFWHGASGENVLVINEESSRQEANNTMQLIVDEAAGNAPFQYDKIRTLLISFFILAARATEDKNSSTQAQPGQIRLYNFRRLVNEHYARYKLPKDYAAMLYITPNHLNALCNDLLGKSAGEVIRDRIILEAKRQLVNASLSISDIAYSLGFTDNSYFTKFFKKHTGITPEDFKKSMLSVTKIQ